MRIWIIALGVVAVLALAGGYWYGSWESDEVLVKQSADTASEGIKVHGDWEVTVSDPATGEEMVYAFENALMPSGATLLLTAFTDSLQDENQFYITLTDVEGDVVCHTDATDPELVSHNGVFSAAIDGTCESLLEAQITDATVISTLRAGTYAYTEKQNDGKGNMVDTTKHRIMWVSEFADFSSKSGLTIPVGSGQPVSVSVFISFE